MKKFNVFFSGMAQKQLYELDTKSIGRIKSAIKELEENPFKNRPKADVKKLKGSNDPELYRLRIGEFRIIYAVIQNEIKVTEVMLRGKGYKWL